MSNVTFSSCLQEPAVARRLLLTCVLYLKSNRRSRACLLILALVKGFTPKNGLPFPQVIILLAGLQLIPNGTLMYGRICTPYI